MEHAIDSWVREITAAVPLFYPIVVTVIGACVGSFLNVCIYRIPAGRSVVWPGSQTLCGKPIAWYDNIPVFSWLILRGRARCCGRPFSARYLGVELLTAGLFLAAWLTYPPAQALAVMGFLGMMIPAALIDLDEMIIPDVFSIGGAGVGLAVAALVPGLHGQASGVPVVDGARALAVALLGVLVGSGTILWIALVAEKILRKEAMGFGDVKLMGAIGAFCGWEGAVFAIFGGAAVGSLLTGLSFLWSKAFPPEHLPPEEDPRTRVIPGCPWVPAPEKSPALRRYLDQERLPGQIPFGPALVLAAALYLFVFTAEVDLFFAEIGEVLFP